MTLAGVSSTIHGELECLKELFSQRMNFIQQTIDERQKVSNLALDLNVKEIQRRLELLATDVERLRTAMTELLPREIYDQNLHALSEAVHKLQNDYANQQGRGQVLSAVVSVGVSLFVAAITLFGSKLLH